ncbi:hypothetical protein [Vulcanisaeta souniana]|uniref:Uncharacterized protein n=2 Tax=Vulcanisaeta souniana JCM 11219 TaxID=1293586 RepID=A0ABM8BR20_9CREN|nr:hypothetical protein [Vulcanisaeta souniana]BDR93350.1 hypothetical protein Vsou_24430 [Vulcanisaeta souniana JCM 11219]
MMTGRYKVFINRKMGRILVSGKSEDLSLIKEGWRIIYEDNDWKNAFEFARDYADKHDYVLEWYLEEESEVLKDAMVN